MTLEALATFLNEANKATYANKDAQKAPSSRPGSEDYHFEKDGLVYHDTYFGSRDFIGGEVVYEGGKVVWGANYFGFVLDEAVGEKDVYAFLREALMQEGGGVVPVRGPAHYKAGNKEYRFVVEGGLESFQGTEEILFDSRVVYRCHLHGGMVR